MSHRAVGRTGMAAARSESSPYLTRGRARCPYRAVGRTGMAAARSESSPYLTRGRARCPYRAVGRTGMAAARSESSPYLTRGRARCPYRAVGRGGKDGGALGELALPKEEVGRDVPIAPSTRTIDSVPAPAEDRSG